MVVRMGVPRLPLGSWHGPCRRQNQSAGLHALRPDEIVGQRSDLPRRASQEDDFEAPMGVEVDVRCCHDPIEMVMLQIREPPSDSAHVMVVNQRDNSHRLARVVRDDLLDQRPSHQSADGLTPVRVAMLGAELVELPEQLAPNRYAKPDQRLFHRRPPRRSPRFLTPDTTSFAAPTNLRHPSFRRSRETIPKVLVGLPLPDRVNPSICLDPLWANVDFRKQGNNRKCC